MTALERIDLPASQKAQLAASAFVGQGRYGAMQELATDFEVSRPTLYEAATLAGNVLEDFFEREASGDGTVSVPVNKAHLRRAIVALRALSPCPLRSIEDLIPILFPGVHVSYGKIQETVSKAQEKATAFNASVELSRIEAAALDEMFSQGAPVLAGVDLDYGYLFGLLLRESRSGDDWAAFLELGKKQGLDLKVAVKDAALGIQAGVERAFPEAEQRDDCFHARYEINKVRGLLERSAYGAIAQEVDAEHGLAEERRTGRGNRKKLIGKLIAARRRCNVAIKLYDDYDAAARDAEDAMELIDLTNGQIPTAEEMESAIRVAADRMVALDHHRCRKVGRYIRNRAPGLAKYMRTLRDELMGLAVDFGDSAVRLGCLISRLGSDLQRKARPWNRAHLERDLVGAALMLDRIAGPKAADVLEAVEAALERRHRASSAVEGLNSGLRPHLYVHKRVTQGFLELFRASRNLRKRRWGRHKGTSAHELLTGERVEDWLTMLGYPPAAAAA